MKPRNKFEKAVLEQSKHLRSITTTQSKWAFRECIDHFAYRLPKGRTTCMDCGHSWIMESLPTLAPAPIVGQGCWSGKPLSVNCNRSGISPRLPLTESTKCCVCFSSWLKWRKVARQSTMHLKSVSIGGTHKEERRLLPFREYWADTSTPFPIARLWQ